MITDESWARNRRGGTECGMEQLPEVRIQGPAVRAAETHPKFEIQPDNQGPLCYLGNRDVVHKPRETSLSLSENFQGSGI